MQEQKVDVFRFQARKACVDAREDVLLGKIKASLPNPAFRLENYLFTEIRVHREHLSEKALTFSAAVNIGMIKEVDSVLHRGTNQFFPLRSGKTGDPHAAKANLRRFHAAAAQFDLIQKNSSCSLLFRKNRFYAVKLLCSKVQLREYRRVLLYLRQTACTDDHRRRAAQYPRQRHLHKATMIAFLLFIIEIFSCLVNCGYLTAQDVLLIISLNDIIKRY